MLGKEFFLHLQPALSGYPGTNKVGEVRPGMAPGGLPPWTISLHGYGEESMVEVAIVGRQNLVHNDLESIHSGQEDLSQLIEVIPIRGPLFVCFLLEISEILQ